MISHFSQVSSLAILKKSAYISHNQAFNSPILVCKFSAVSHSAKLFNAVDHSTRSRNFLATSFSACKACEKFSVSLPEVWIYAAFTGSFVALEASLIASDIHKEKVNLFKYTPPEVNCQKLASIYQYKKEKA
jgi:hypothetical protein